MQVQRLQRHATYGHFKQMVLQIIADDVIDNGHDPDKVFATLRSAPGPPASTRDCAATAATSRNPGPGSACLHWHTLAPPTC